MSSAIRNPNTSFAGRLVGGNSTTSFAVQIPGYAWDTPANFLVRGWSADWGDDWSQVKQELESQTYGSFYGESVIATDVYLAPFGGPYNSLFGPQQSGLIPGFTLNDMVPEPSVLALLLLGAGALARSRPER